MPMRAARKTARRPVPRPSEDEAADGEDLPSKQLAFEASTATAPRLGDAPEFLKTNGDSQRNAESVGILARAATKRIASKKLNPVKQVEARNPKKRKQGLAVFDVEDDDEEKEEEAAPASRRAAKAAALPAEYARQTRGTAAAQSPQVTKKTAKWTKAEDKKLMDMVDGGVPLVKIHDQMEEFTLTEIRNRAADLQEQRGGRFSTSGIHAKLQRTTKAAGTVKVQKAAQSSQPLPWTAEEDDELLRKYTSWGWDRLYTIFPRRSQEDMRNRWSYLQEEIVYGRRPAPQPEPEKRPAKRARTKATTFRKAGTPELHHSAPAQQDTPSSARKRRKRTIEAPEVAHQDAPTKVAPKEARKRTGQKQPSPEIPETDADAAADEEEDEVIADSIEADAPTEREHVDDTFMGDKLSDAEDDGEDEDDDDGEQENGEDADGATGNAAKQTPALPVNLDFLGQASALNDIFEAIKMLTGKTYKHDFKDRSRKRGVKESHASKAIFMHSEKLGILFDKLPRTSRIEELRDAIDKRLERLASSVKHLDPTSAKDDLTIRTLVQQANTFTVADLVSLLEKAMLPFVDLRPTDEGLKLWFLDKWSEIMAMIVGLYKRSTEWKTSFVGVKKIRQDILVPVKKILLVFDKRRRSLHTAVLRATQRATQQEEERINQQRDEVNEAQEQRLQHLWDKKHMRLYQLFSARAQAARIKRWTEGPFAMSQDVCKSYADWRTEQAPYHGAEVELDANGEPFERVGDVFGRRRSAPRAQRPEQEEEDVPWDDREMTVLLVGLRKTVNDSNIPITEIWPSFFRHFCKPGDALEERTLPDILRVTKSFLDQYRIGADEADDELEEGTLKESCPEWLKSVPDLELVELLW